MINVLFISSTGRYDLDKINAIYQKKFAGFSKIGNVHQIAIGKGDGICNGVHLHLCSKLFFLLQAYRKGCSIIKDNDIDVVYCQSPLLDGLVGVLLKWRTKVKLVIGIHGNWEVDLAYTKKRFLIPLINKLAGFTLKRADMVRVISKATEQRALNYIDKKKIFSVHFPALFDVEFFLKDEPVESNENSAMFMGSLRGIKNVKKLILASYIVKKQFPDFKLYILGIGPMETELKAMANKHIEFLGYQPQEVVKQYLDRTKMLVLPSVSEGLGRSALEAMARGKPVVGTDVEGINEIINHNRGVLVKPTPEDIARGITMLLESPDMCKWKGEKAREYVKKHYSFERYMDNYTTLFKEVLNGNDG